MKIFRLLLIIALAIAVSFVSWSYYTSKSLQEKHERAKLVFEKGCSISSISDWRDSDAWE